MCSRTLLCVVCVCLIVVVCVVDAGNNGTAAANTSSSNKDGPITHSVSGTFRGAWMETRRGRRFQAYRGIRYADPPVGALRFQPPHLILHYDRVVDASEEGPSCPRPASPGYFVDEDCLTINVYTPGGGRNSTKSLPVIFFIHPGGFYSMSGRSDLAGPHYLLDRDVVLVTINYRLGSLGFLALGNQLAPGNNGFKDQVAALRWVQRNIAAFGGDPDLVTISGCSAGAVSVMVHMISPMSKGLFHRAIALSGSPTSKVASPPDRVDLAIKQATVSKCPANNLTALYECLKTKPWQEIAGSVLGFFEFGYDPLSLWRPVVEPDFGQERFLTEDPMLSIREGRMHSVPFIVSQTTGEFFWKAFTVLNNQTLLDTMNSEWDRIAPISFILPRNETSGRLAALRKAYFGDQPLGNDTATADALGKLYGDAITAFPVHRMANLMCRHSSHPVYYTEFAYVGNRSHYEDPVTKKPVRAAHHDDLIYLFTLSYRFPTIDVADTEDSKMVDKMTAIWYNFARYGDPNPREDTGELASLSWPAMTPDNRTYLRVTGDFTVKQNLYEERFHVWDQLYHIQY
ncbi:esterase E4-like isoform X1 [Spodoptera frugiperda]|uniref:Carboxylic ester hydrolase n=2 Tax=Spodoptera frugiperda TaxID=7108 RepID=A0A9R0DVX4_SPOFR|nr:esterase E4-like isoform X1 [Spodoptera frugiperda]